MRNEAIDDEIDIKKLALILWGGKWVILCGTVLFCAIAIAIAMTLPNIYKAEVLVMPVQDGKSGELQALAGQFGGLASLAGINFSAESDKTKLAIEVLKSREFLTRFIERHDLLIPVMAADGWDLQTNTLKLDSSIYDVEREKWVRSVKLPFESKPTLLEAHKIFLEENLVVSHEKSTGLATIGVNFYSPFYARDWATFLLNDLNDEMRKREIEEAKRSIEFLEKQISKTTVADIKTVLFQLIEQQTKKLMFAEIRNEFVFKVIDPAIAPLEKSKPNRIIIVTAGAMLGLFFSVLFVMLRAVFVKNSKDQ